MSDTVRRLDELMERYASIHAEMEADPDIRQMKDELLALEVRIATAEIPYRDDLSMLEFAIKELALEHAATYEAHGIHVKHRKGYERASWADKPLMGYATAHPEILEFRKVTQVAPSVKVEVV